jgi:hypothetical protein
MPQWVEDLSVASLEEVFRSQTENRAWHKELRLQTATLINNRLAKRISLDEYAANRKVGAEEAAECKRRAAILVKEINGRCVPSLPW